MKFGFVLPYGDASAAGQLAELAENCGWDGFFVWEPIWGFDAHRLGFQQAYRQRGCNIFSMEGMTYDEYKYR